MIEAQLTNPSGFRDIAPQAQALTEQAAQAQSDESLGALLSGETPAAAPVRQRQVADEVDKQQSLLPPTPANETPQQAAKRSNGAVKYALQHAEDAKNWTVLKGGFTMAIANVYKKHLPSLGRYVALVRRGQADRTAAVLDIDAIVGRYKSLDKIEGGTKEGSVNALLKESTRSRKWAFTPDWLPAGTVQVDVALAAKYAKLSPEARRVVRDVFKHGHDSTLKMRQQALDAFDHELDAVIAQYRKQGNTVELRKAEEKKLRSVATFDWLADLNANWPYAPLKRFGDYVVIAECSYPG